MMLRQRSRRSIGVIVAVSCWFLFHKLYCKVGVGVAHVVVATDDAAKDTDDDDDETCQASSSSPTEKHNRNNNNDDDDDSICRDLDTQCLYWASLGDCICKAEFMSQTCRHSCELCPRRPHDKKDVQCLDKLEGATCPQKAKQGHCITERDYMYHNCPKSCFLCSDERSLQQMFRGADMGVPQMAGESDYHVDPIKILETIRSARQYLHTTTNFPEYTLELCVNKDPLCAAFAVEGQCHDRYMKHWMQKDCAPVCKSCDQLTIEGRCPMDPSTTEQDNIWKPGDLQILFERLTTSEPFLTEYKVQVHSSPNQNNDAPWIITLENVLTSEEAQRVIELGTSLGYQRSSDIGERNKDGSYTSDYNLGRTSTNTWCIEKECSQDPIVQSILFRLSNITGIPQVNSEPLQLLRYESGQYYTSHHDYIPHHGERQPGGRILTLFLYLNDVEQGGETHFDELGITITPKVGRAVLWPNVYNDNPTKPDLRTSHEALPVQAGVKYGANAWIHLRDWETAKRNKCV